ncbi:MAG: histidine phosphatase family protein [Desulfarculus sp.]|nr:histidine phosphatase family protein [Pseudomonadota bacterium]MBV1717915.1 histidine phosphatase family protein [Desulfarculus sp.]MBU4576846.1 histidine phosphatase family protein [Pseudomonadota bacterium]MBU4598097.1 histidine phosphatase family protein [Pseudomonadota bacterium]MBV1739865.1 histidine phosphatase family protein [Desulfarculus sp.]
MIYLLRHGEITQSIPRRFVGRRDLPLTELGRTQAAQWGELLREMRFQAVYTSPLSRCQDTARLAAPGREIVLEPGWTEISLGEWEGLSVDQVRERFPGEYEARGEELAGHRPQGGESFAQVADRVTPLLEALADGPAPVLVVAHSGVIRAGLCRLLGLPLGHLLRLELDYAGLCLVERGPQGWKLHGFNLLPEGL